MAHGVRPGPALRVALFRLAERNTISGSTISARPAVSNANPDHPAGMVTVPMDLVQITGIRRPYAFRGRVVSLLPPELALGLYVRPSLPSPRRARAVPCSQPSCRHPARWAAKPR